MSKYVHKGFGLHNFCLKTFPISEFHLIVDN